MKESVAQNFAALSETDELDQVLLKIKFENKKGRHYICLDRKEYSMYPDEQEVLLQAGLKAKIQSFEIVDDVTIFNLFISDDVVQREKRKRTLDFAIPVAIYGLEQLFMSAIKFYYDKNNRIRLTANREQNVEVD